tara:strand:+ start:191 stop:553 length:363 start_codon:yes stop_codon:yes gene_type:complete
MVGYLLSFGVGMSSLPWTLSAEIFPLKERSLCVGIATSVNWVANFIVAASFLSLQAAISRAGAFWLYGVIAFAGGMWLHAVLPETAGKSLEEIESLFAPRWQRGYTRQEGGQCVAAPPMI